MTFSSRTHDVTTFCCCQTLSAPTVILAAPGHALYAEESSARTRVCFPSACSKKYEMPASSRRRETKAKWVSLYCTQYSSGGYVPLVALRRSVKPSSLNRPVTMSTTLLFCQIRQSALMVVSHSHGLSSAW